MAPYLVAIEQRLSADDVVPHGQSVRFDLTELMRPATSDLVTMIATLYPMGLLGREEARDLLGHGPGADRSHAGARARRGTAGRARTRGRPAARSGPVP